MESVDLTNFLSLTALMHFARYLAIFNVVHATLKDKKNSLITFFGIVIPGMLWSFVSIEYLISAAEVLLFSIALLVCVVSIFITCKGSVFSKIAAAIFAYESNQLSAIIISLIMTPLGVPESYYSSTKVNEIFIISSSILVFSFSCIYAFIIKFIKNKFSKTNSIKSKKTYFFFVIPFTNILYFSSYIALSQFLGNDLINSNTYNKIRPIFITFAALCFAASISLLFLVDYIAKIERKNIESEKQILANSMTYQQTIMLKEEKKELRKIKHDINNLLTTATGFIELGKPDKALDILNKTGDSVFGAVQSAICSNEIINTVFFIKQQDATGKGVELSFTVEENDVVRIAEYDLCRLLHNLIDNSINAVEKLEAENKSDITIKIDNNTVFISTQNAFDNNAKIKIHDKNHGYGTTIIKEICKKYNGQYIAKTDGNKYITNVTVNNITK